VGKRRRTPALEWADVLFAKITDEQIDRAWKIKMIEKHNSGWNDLYSRLLGEIALPELPGALPSHRANARCSPGMTSGGDWSAGATWIPFPRIALTRAARRG
jgi:hypothetical protein